MIIDAHAHIFPEVRGLIADGPTRSLGYGRITAGNQTLQLLPPYNEKTAFTPEMLLANLDWAGVDRAILLQGTFYGECNETVQAALRRYPDRLIGAAYLDPWADDCRQMWERVAASALFRAVKLELSVSTGLCGIHLGARLDEPDIAWLWAELAGRGLVLVLDLGAAGTASYQTGAVRAIAENHPDLRIVIAHLAQPRPEIETDAHLRELWQQQIDLGLLPNIWFDCAALCAYYPLEDFPYPSAARYLRLALERIGPGKVLWGSDQPGILSIANYPQLVRMARLHTAFLSPGDQAWMLGGNAARVFG